MKQTKLQRTYLIIAGLIGLGVGAASLLIPVAFHATSGIPVADNTNLLNEMRGAGGGLLAGGLLIGLGALIKRLLLTSIAVSVVLYLGYGLARVVSMWLDGMPGQSLVIVAALELTIGVLGMTLLYKKGAVTI